MSSSNENTHEKETKPQAQKREPCDPVRASLGLGILGLILGAVVIPAWPLWGSCGVVGLALGISALYRTIQNHGVPSSYIGPVVGAGLNSVVVFWALSASVCHLPSRALGQRVVCGSNLHALGKAMGAYAAHNNGNYPDPNRWCDLLIKDTDMEAESFAKLFVCRCAVIGGDDGKCHYAINPNCEPNSPNDVILLFESKGGWNQVGGPELLAPENHDGDGCNVLFNDGHVLFVRTQALGKLKWK